MWTSEPATPSIARPIEAEEDVAKMIEVDIEVGVTGPGKITPVEVDWMTSRPIDIMGDEAQGQGSGCSCHFSDA